MLRGLLHLLAGVVIVVAVATVGLCGESGVPAASIATACVLVASTVDRPGVALPLPLLLWYLRDGYPCIQTRCQSGCISCQAPATVQELGQGLAELAEPSPLPMPAGKLGVRHGSCARKPVDSLPCCRCGATVFDNRLLLVTLVMTWQVFCLAARRNLMVSQGWDCLVRPSCDHCDHGT